MERPETFMDISFRQSKLARDHETAAFYLENFLPDGVGDSDRQHHRSCCPDGVSIFARSGARVVFPLAPAWSLRDRSRSIAPNVCHPQKLFTARSKGPGYSRFCSRKCGLNWVEWDAGKYWDRRWHLFRDCLYLNDLAGAQPNSWHS